MKKLKIGIVGCGAIGSSLSAAVAKDFKAEAELCGLYDIDQSKSCQLSRRLCGSARLAAHSLKELIRRSSLIIEAASAKSSALIARDALNAGCDIMVMSVGGLLGAEAKLILLAQRHNRRIYIPSGALCGVDGLKAARIGRIKSVCLTTRKNPLSFKGVKYVEDKGFNLAKIKKDTLLFSGPAARAVRYFPQNINVAAVLSLAGIGSSRTTVRIVASPKTKKNIHEVNISSEAACISTRTENVLHPKNRKTSYLAVLSAIATLKQILEPVRIGS